MRETLLSDIPWHQKTSKRKKTHHKVLLGAVDLGRVDHTVAFFGWNVLLPEWEPNVPPQECRLPGPLLPKDKAVENRSRRWFASLPVIHPPLPGHLQCGGRVALESEVGQVLQCGLVVKKGLHAGK